MEVDASRARNLGAWLCFRCHKPVHISRDCVLRFDVCYMTVEERDLFAQEVFASIDADEAGAVEEEEQRGEAEERETSKEAKEDFAPGRG